MSSWTASPDAPPQLRTLGVGLLLGLLIAFGWIAVTELVVEQQRPTH